MDIGLFILVMIVLYVVPELLKRFRKKQPYQYPEFPQTGERSENVNLPGTLSQGMEPPPVPSLAATGEGLPGDEGEPAWKARTGVPVLITLEQMAPSASLYSLNSQEAMKGVVWAEIIAPPVSLRRRRSVVKRV